MFNLCRYRVCCGNRPNEPVVSSKEGRSVREKMYRVAVIGSTGRGNYGHGLDTAWLKVPNTKLVAVADDDPAGLEAAGKRLGVDKTFRDYIEMLDRTEPEIVTIATRWIDRHHEMMMAAIERGIHVFIEKPFCRTLVEADEIVKAAQSKHIKIAIAHPTRYSPTMETVQRLIQEGAIGEVLELRGRGIEDRRGGGEDLWVLCAHVFDMMLTLGHEPKWCFASITLQGRPVTAADVYEGGEGIGPIAGDAIHAVYGMDSGLTATVQTHRNASSGQSRFGLRVYGSRGIIEIFEGTLPPVYILQDASWSTRDPNSAWKKISTAGIDKPEPLMDPKYRDRNILAIESLLQSIELHKEPKCNAEQGRVITEMILAPYESMRQQNRVSIPLENREHPLKRLLDETSDQK